MLEPGNKKNRLCSPRCLENPALNIQTASNTQTEKVKSMFNWSNHAISNKNTARAMK